MARPVVVDASMAIPLVHAEPGSAVVAARVRQWRASGTRLAVPAQFWLEVANVLLRRHRRPGSAVVAALHALDEIGLETIESDRPLVLLALDRAERFGLSMYDASYLALAELLDGGLFTDDRELLAAAGSRGIGLDLSGHNLSEETSAYGGTSAPTWPDYRAASAWLAKLRAEAREPVGGSARR